MDLKDKRVLVVGLGKSGVASALFLKDRGLDADDATVERITNRIKDAALILKNALPKSLLDQIIAEEVGKAEREEVAVGR